MTKGGAVMRMGYEGMADAEAVDYELQRRRAETARRRARESGLLEAAVEQAASEVGQSWAYFSTLSPNRQRIHALRRAISGLGGRPGGAASPSAENEPVTIALLEEQLLDLQVGALPVSPVAETAITRPALSRPQVAQPAASASSAASSATPVISLPDETNWPDEVYAGMTDDEVLAYRLRQLREEQAKRNARESGQLDTAVDEAASAIEEAAPGFAGLPPTQKRVTALRRAITDLGETPVGASFPDPVDMQQTIAVLEEQLLNLQTGAQPSLTFTRAAARLNEAAASGNPPSNAATETFGVDYVPPIAGSATDRPVRSAREEEVRRRMGYAQDDARKALEGSAFPLDLYPERQKTVKELQEAIRARGDVAEVTGDPADGEETNAILALRNQLRSIIELEIDTAQPGNIGETDTLGGVNAEEAAVVGTPFRSSSVNADPALKRDFNEDGVNTAARSTDELSRERFFEGDEVTGDPPTPLALAFRRIRPLFKQGELESFFLDFLADQSEIGFLTPKEQAVRFLTDVAVALGANALPFTDPNSPTPYEDQLILRLTSSIRGLEESLSGKLDFDGRDFNPYRWLSGFTEQLIPDSIAENLPTPLRIVVQSALDLTAPLNAFLFLTTGGSGSFARAIVGELVGNVLSQIAEEAGAPILVQALAGILGGNVAENAPELLGDFSSIANRVGQDSLGQVRKFREAISQYGIRGALDQFAADLPADFVSQVDKFLYEGLGVATTADLTDLDDLKMQVAVNAFVNSLGEVAESKAGYPDAYQSIPVPIGELLHNDIAQMLTKKIDGNDGLSVAEKAKAESALTRILRGLAPDAQGMEALIYGLDIYGTEAESIIYELSNSGTLLMR